MRWIPRILAGLVLAAAGCGDEAPSNPAAERPAATEAASSREAEDVRAVAERYLAAVWAADLDAVCEASSAQVRKRKGAICDIAKKGEAEHPPGDPPAIGEVRVQAKDIAVARADGGVTLTLLRSGGRWGVDNAIGLPELRVTPR